MTKPTTLTIAVWLLTAGCISTDYGADYAAYESNAAALGSETIEPHDGVIENITVVNTHACAGESVEIKVEATNNDADVFIDGHAGVRHLIQLSGDPGPRELDVFVDGPAGRALVAVKIEIIACETTMPMIEVQAQARRERDIHVSVDSQRHEGPFWWEFSDGTRLSTDTPWIDHRIAPADLDWTEDYSTQQVMVTTGSGLTAIRTFNIELDYGQNRERGIVNAPIDYDPANPSAGVVVHNVERDDAMVITTLETTLRFCEPGVTAPPTETRRSLTVVYGQGANSFFATPESADVCGMDIRFRGYMKLSGFRVESTAYFAMRNRWIMARLPGSRGEALRSRLELEQTFFRSAPRLHVE